MNRSPREFYTMMWYPIPESAQYFMYKTKQSTTQPQKSKKLSQHTINHIQTIKKYSRLRNNLPFIKAVYLCDSTSFNATTEKSDIDLFFIVNHKSIRRARFRSVCIFWILWLKRTLQKKTWLFDLIFYVDEKKSDLSTIALSPEDIYLTYRLAHLIPIYQENPNTYNIYTHNQRIKNTLPNFPMKHSIGLPIQTIEGKWTIKKFLELLSGQWADNFWEYIIKHTRKPLVIKKKLRHWKQGRGVIINDFMLKFHLDKRKTIQANWKKTTTKKDQ